MIIFRKDTLETELAALRDEWRVQMERSLKAVADESISRLGRDSEAMEKEVASHVAKLGEALTEVTAQTETKLSGLREALDRQDERSHTALRQLQAAEERIGEQADKIAQASGEADRKLNEARQHLEEQNERLRESLRQLHAAEQRISDQSAKLTETTGEADFKISDVRRYLDEQTQNLYESLRQLQAADERLRDQLSKLDLLAQAAGQNLESRAAAVLDATSREMTRRAEETMLVWSDQIRTIQDSTGQEIERFTNQLKSELSSRLAGTHETLKNIEAATAAAQESLQHTQESLSRVSDQALEAAAGRMQAFVQELIGNSERQMEESGRAATAKWIAALEDKATDATYTAFGSLFKVSEWCEKKAQMHMQAALEKGLNAASDNVREQADHSLREVSAKADAAAGQIAASIEQGQAQIRAGWETEGEQLGSRLRTTLREEVQNALDRASQDLRQQVTSVLDNIRAETQAQENRLKDMIAHLGDQAVQSYELRLDQVSRSSLQEAIGKFSQESSVHLESLVRTAEQDLRVTCNQVFTEVGEALRQRLLELTFLRPTAKAATESA